jgi:hypothetical protein
MPNLGACSRVIVQLFLNSIPTHAPRALPRVSRLPAKRFGATRVDTRAIVAHTRHARRQPVLCLCTSLLGTGRQSFTVRGVTQPHCPQCQCLCNTTDCPIRVCDTARVRDTA